MGWTKDMAPVGPTCLKIDAVISSLNDLYRSSEPIGRGELSSIESALEKLREDNAKLRDWGNEQYEIAYEMEKEVDYYKDLSEKQKSEIDELRSEIKELEKQVV